MCEEFKRGQKAGVTHKVGQGKSLIQHAEKEEFKKKVLSVGGTGELIGACYDNNFVMFTGRMRDKEEIIEENVDSMPEEKKYISPTWRIV